ncbi:MAG TPA: M12 family metallopeptidase, partial [Bdellovibrionota bacterium]|nr:M12 family metallopeptidase [Bdellovibrionota bacterium]
SDWVSFMRVPSNGTCASSVGMQGGVQPIFIGDACGTGNLIHEIGHLVGLWHEQNRADRDKHVLVRWENVASGQGSQFALAGVWGKDRGAYDYSSIMHYPADAFSSNGLPTIETLPEGIPIGQRFSLSAGDVAGVSELYGTAASLAVQACP